ncbi:MAG: dTDP-glucose 4,6-dehydratase [Bdellovibrionales bacterium]|nr:dTDP-glucose 4,6-dehydratase [Bdellovibrionales bacterium]
MHKRKKVLLTGCAGFIGSNFVKNICTKKEILDEYSFVILDSLTYAGRLENIQPELDKYPESLSFVQIDIRDGEKIDRLFKGEEFWGCMNFAAESHVDRSIESANLFVETNVLGTMNLLNSSLHQFKQTGEFRYLQISTDEVYGTLSLTDPAFTEKNPIEPNSPYSASKAGADCLVRSFFETHKLPTIITRCSNNYGPYQFDEKFIPVVLKKSFRNESIPVYGNGTNIRDWIFVDDHNLGCWAAFTKGIPGEIYNLGGATELTNLDLAKKILKAMGKPESLITFVEDRKGHDFRYAINFEKATRELGWKPEVTFEAGLKKTLEHYESRFSL